MPNPKKEIVNCHTHIFTGDHVPPFIAKAFVPPPLHFLFPLHPILKVYKSIHNWRMNAIHRPGSGLNRAKRLIDYARKSFGGRLVIFLVKAWLALNTFHIVLIEWIKLPTENWHRYIKWAIALLTDVFMVVPDLPRLVQILIVLIALTFFKSIRNLLFFALRNSGTFFKHLPGKNTKALIQRYILIGKYTMYQSQASVYTRLKHQYPDGTKFIVLPMDMKYMQAGPINKAGGYYAQMKELATIKSRSSGKNLRPFVFIDPRRMRDPKLKAYIESTQLPADVDRVTNEVEQLTADINRMKAQSAGNKRSAALNNQLKKERAKLNKKQLHLDDLTEIKSLFEYTIEKNAQTGENEVILKDNTLVKQYIEDKGFSGFKIYPALGYYPFDEDLLALWKYAADHQIPIMTHCISGTIFFRGKKDKNWDEHPVLRESDGKGGTRPLALPEVANIDFSVNFGHPMNYLCLLEEQLLRKILATYKNPELNKLFGFTGLETPLKQDLSKLKICMAHFGGEDEWVKYLETDRYPYAQRLIRDRKQGLNFRFDRSSINWNVMSDIWKHVDWYSIICSLIIQYPNVYADISYILSKPRILPLLKETLDPNLNPHLSQRVLFGTDFYVVRNHFSDKDLLIQMKGELTDDEFDLIARKNPASYL